MGDAPVLWHPSPNCGERRNGARPDLVVLHYTAMDTAGAALERLCDPAAEVSAHYLIGRCGTCWQLVAEEARAWHAGAGSWGGRADVNSHSIGIELDNDGRAPFSAPLMDRLEWLLRQLLERGSIPPERVIGHSDMAPGRKIDPGRRFDWQRLARRGLACGPAARAEADLAAAARAGAPSEAAFRTALCRLGYPDDARTEALLDAFRARFRPQVSGPLTGADIALARHLAARFAVDPGGATA